MFSSFEVLVSFCSGIMKDIWSIFGILELPLIQITQKRPWGCSCHPETTKINSVNIGPTLWKYFKIVGDSTSVTSNYLMHIYLMMELYDTEQVAQWNSECCQRAIRYRERFSQLKSTEGSKVMAPIHTPWDSGYFIISLHQKIAVNCLHIFCMSSLSLCQTKSCGGMSMYFAKIHL